MNDLVTLRTQIRFALGQLSGSNGHHLFEELCRDLARQRLCSNILPATGPVSDGGDQGRDFETFHTYLLQHPVGDTGGFIGLASADSIVFACTLQKDNIATKVHSDIKTITATGTKPARVYFFCEANVPVGARHTLQDWARETHAIRLEIFDGMAIAELLASPDTFWIASRYLGIPEEAYPRSADISDDNSYALSVEYWRSNSRPRGMADLEELKGHARYALHNEECLPDLPLWLSRIRTIATDVSDNYARHRAVPELVALSIRAHKTLSGLESLIQDYFADLQTFTDGLDLTDAATTCNYVAAAIATHAVEIPRPQLDGWREALTVLIDKLIEATSEDKRPNVCADLLNVRGYVALAPNAVGERPNVAAALVWWNKLLDLAPSAPLFAITRFADHLTQFVQLIGNDQRFRDLAARADKVLAARHGNFAAAERARDRAMEYYEAHNIPCAIEELQRAKVYWFAEETLTGSILAFLTCASWYREVGAHLAAKHCALAAAYIAVMAKDAEARKRFPQALAAAAESDYEQGAWCSYLELLTVTERAAAIVLSAADDQSAAFQGLLFAGAMVRAITERLVPSRISYVETMLSSPGLGEIIREVTPDARKNLAKRDSVLKKAIASQLAGPPFSDSGTQRTVAWVAYGTEWIARWTNDYSTTPAAEGFCAGLQVFLVDLYDVDLHLIRTKVDIEVEVREHATPSIERKQSTATCGWKILLPAITGKDELFELQKETFAFGMVILRAIALLPQQEFADIVEARFVRGLVDKLNGALPYPMLYREFIPEELFVRSDRTDKKLLGRPRARPNSALPWRRTDGHTYDKADSLRRIAERYKYSLIGLRYTLPRVRSSAVFQNTVRELRKVGWLDWHILMALLNAVRSFRLNRRVNAGEELAKVATEIFSIPRDQPESENDPPPPIEALSAQHLRDALEVSYASTLSRLGLVVDHEALNSPALEEFLRHRYHYWSDDIEHDDPFADPSQNITC